MGRFSFNQNRNSSVNSCYYVEEKVRAEWQWTWRCILSYFGKNDFHFYRNIYECNFIQWGWAPAYVFCILRSHCNSHCHIKIFLPEVYWILCINSFSTAKVRLQLMWSCQTIFTILTVYLCKIFVIFLGSLSISNIYRAGSCF